MKNNKTFSKVLTFALAVMLVLPLGASANNSKNGKNNDRREEKKIEKMEKIEMKAEVKAEKKALEKICWNRSYKRFFTWGWLKKNINVIDLDANCLPKKPHATTTDTTAPIISDIVSKTGVTRALIIWNTNERTTGKIYYSTASPVNLASATTISVNDKNLGGKNHYAILGSLASSTTYYAVIESKDRAGNTSVSSQFSFTTKSGTSAIPTDIVAPTISNIITSVSSTTINVSWHTDENSTSKVYYSTSTPLSATTSPFILNSSLILSHSLKIENLATGTPYFLMIESTDASANTSTSTVFSTTTLNN